MTAAAVRELLALLDRLERKLDAELDRDTR